MSDSPPKKKSHYFVAHNKISICPVCGKEFEKRIKTQHYCSKECYNINIKQVKAAWYQKHKDRIKPKQREYEYKKYHSRPPKPKVDKFEGHLYPLPVKYENWIVFKRHLIIKQELAYYELLPKQIKRRNKYYYGRVKKIKVKNELDPVRLDYIKERLLDFELPHVIPRDIEFPVEKEYLLGDLKKVYRQKFKKNTT